ncbi:MAG: type V CRISPR-associated endonuclease Cas1 [Candidatus Methanomethylophilaceae archaeon]|jgi:CRISPR-associated protein Cas1
MLSKNDFKEKQMVFVFTRNGDKISFSNDNLAVKDISGNIRFQTTCYRVFALFIVGDITITSGIIRKSHKFGFPIIMMTSSLKVYDMIGHKTEGNFILRRLQYEFDGFELAKHIVENKITNQKAVLNFQRGKDDRFKSDVALLADYASAATEYEGDYRGLMGIEGNASKIFFRNNFNTDLWAGRKPRIKSDYINATLDIGYTILFNIVDSMLNLYGFDTYCGIYHREFYMRKSLTCDLVEPFRSLIDWQVRKAVNLGQCKSEDFNMIDGKYLLDIRNNQRYTSFLMEPIIENKDRMFAYFQSYYRAFMKQKSADCFPVFQIGD